MRAHAVLLVLLCACTDAPADGPAGAADAGGPLPPPGPVLDGAGGAPGGPDEPAPPVHADCVPDGEICDALDNDCDGLVDEVGCACTGADMVCFAGPPGARWIGECRDGTRVCDATGELIGPCEGSVGPAPEICDGLDNDCDDRVDEGCGEDGPDGPDEPYTPDDPPGAGEESFVVGQARESAPVDFVMAVDNSGSMRDTVAQVEGNLGTFSTRLVDAGVDYRFVLVSEKGTRARDPDICIPPPMAGPDCSDTERFRHLDQEIGSHSAFAHLLRCHARCDDTNAGYGGFLRPEALLQIIVVTDDESNLDWARFRDEMMRLAGEFILHGVVGLEDRGCVADVGDQYILGARETGGELLHICDQDWGRVLDVILDATVVRLQRIFRLQGQPDPATIEVFTVAPGAMDEQPAEGWSYDEPSNSIELAEDRVPPAGTRVIVRYRPR